MKKPASLRAALVAALDRRHGLSKDPARLQMTVTNAKILADARPGGGFDYSYTLEIVLLDFAGVPEEVTVPLMQWVARWQHSLLANQEAAAQGIDMTVSLMEHNKVDILIDLKLTEAVVFTPRPGEEGAVDVVYLEPPVPMALQLATSSLHAVYLDGELIAHCAAHPGEGL